MERLHYETEGARPSSGTARRRLDSDDGNDVRQWGHKFENRQLDVVFTFDHGQATNSYIADVDPGVEGPMSTVPYPTTARGPRAIPLETRASGIGTNVLTRRN